jgi:hypothetical protein
MLISSLYHRAIPSKYVRVRRINRETMRVKLAKASHVAAPRLVADGKLVKVHIAR